MITLLNKYLGINSQPNKYAWYDLGQAVGNLSVQATASGLRMRQMGGFDPAKTRDLFGIAQNYEPASVISIGYPGEIKDLDPVLQKKELCKRYRKPLNEIVFNASDKESIVN